MNEKEIIEKVWNWYKENDCFDGKSDWYVFQRISKETIKLCNEAHANDLKELSECNQIAHKRIEELTEAHEKEIEELKEKLESRKIRVRELQEQISELGGVYHTDISKLNNQIQAMTSEFEKLISEYNTIIKSCDSDGSLKMAYNCFIGELRTLKEAIQDG